jgi:predicted ester cyclase
MSTEQNKEIVRRMFDQTNAQDLTAAFSALSPEFVDHALDLLGPGMPHGIEGTRQFFTMVFSAFPDVRVTTEDMIAEGDRVVTRDSGLGTHTGAYMGIPPTGKQVRFSFINIYRLQDGKIVEHWTEADNLGLMQQLGVVPSPRDQ